MQAHLLADTLRLLSVQSESEERVDRLTLQKEPDDCGVAGCLTSDSPTFILGQDGTCSGTSRDRVLDPDLAAGTSLVCRIT